MNKIEFKGRMLTCMVIRTPESGFDEEALDAQLPKMKGLLDGMPVLLDTNPDDLNDLAAGLRARGVVPSGVYKPDDATLQVAQTLSLSVIKDRRGGAERSFDAPDEAESQSSSAAPEVAAPETASEATPAVVPAAQRPAAKVVEKPVRSGQQIYAKGTDLIVLGAVSEGAEVIADGSIHIYGRLAGRALAGAHGDESARVFCSNFQPELVSIAGCYAINENFAPEHNGQALQISLSNETLQYTKL